MSIGRTDELTDGETAGDKQSGMDTKLTKSATEKHVGSAGEDHQSRFTLLVCCHRATR